MAKRVLALGLDPVFADFSQMPGLTPELVRAYIDAQLQRVRTLGYLVQSCLLDLGETAESRVEALLGEEDFDCVVFGAGLRCATAIAAVRKNTEPGTCAGARREVMLQHDTRGYRGGHTTLGMSK